jgi:hypothetical protein
MKYPARELFARLDGTQKVVELQLLAGCAGRPVAVGGRSFICPGVGSESLWSRVQREGRQEGRKLDSGAMHTVARLFWLTLGPPLWRCPDHQREESYTRVSELKDTPIQHCLSVLTGAIHRYDSLSPGAFTARSMTLRGAQELQRGPSCDWAAPRTI